MYARIKYFCIYKSDTINLNADAIGYFFLEIEFLKRFRDYYYY